MAKKGFTLMEVMLGIALAGLLLVMLCGVFVYGLNAIEKGRIRSTALNLAERKISESHNLVKRAGSGDHLKGSDLRNIISDSNEILYSGSPADPGQICKLWINDYDASRIIATGSTSIKDTADFDYAFIFEDTLYRDLKRVCVEIYWEDEERVGIKKVYLESFVSRWQ